jgi:opacity protein-like surface antigen
MMGKAALCGAALFLYAAPASAQMQIRPWTDLVFASVSGAGQTGTRSETANFTFDLYEEVATIDVTRDVKGSAFVDVTFGAAIINNLGAALSIYTRSASADGAMTGSIPHPAEFNQPRSVSGTVAGMAHRETWVGFQAVYGIGLNEKMDVLLMGGPAVAKVEHDVATSAEVTETADLTSPAVTIGTTRLSKTFVGFIVGADVRYFFHANIGAGAFLRWTGASGDFDNGSPIEVGGFQIGAGVRFRY